MARLPLPEIIEVGGSLPQNMVNDFGNCAPNAIMLICVFRTNDVRRQWTLFLRNRRSGASLVWILLVPGNLLIFRKSFSNA